MENEKKELKDSDRFSLTIEGWQKLKELELQRILELVTQLKKDIKSGKVLDGKIKE